MTLSKQHIASLVLVPAIGGVVLFLSLAPVHRMYDAEGCREAYRRARSATDTAHVDLHRYTARTGAGNHRCGELRAVRADTSGLLSLH